MLHTTRSLWAGIGFSPMGNCLKGIKTHAGSFITHCVSSSLLWTWDQQQLDMMLMILLIHWTNSVQLAIIAVSKTAVITIILSREIGTSLIKMVCKVRVYTLNATKGIINDWRNHNFSLLNSSHDVLQVDVTKRRPDSVLSRTAYRLVWSIRYVYRYLLIEILYMIRYFTCDYVTKINLCFPGILIQNT